MAVGSVRGTRLRRRPGLDAGNQLPRRVQFVIEVNVPAPNRAVHRLHAGCNRMLGLHALLQSCSQAIGVTTAEWLAVELDLLVELQRRQQCCYGCNRQPDIYPYPSSTRPDPKRRTLVSRRRP
jgi:hypothetical protein